MKMPDDKRHGHWIKRGAIFVIALLLAGLFFSADFGLAASAGEHGAGEAQGAKGWVATDWFRVFNFVVLAGILFFVLRKPVTQALGSRIAGIKEELADLEAQKEVAEKKLAQYNEKLSQLEKESEKIVSDYIQQGNEARARIIKEAEAAAEKLQSQALRNIEYEFEQAKQRLQEEILEKALVKAEETIKTRITEQDQDRLADEYLSKVVSR